MKKFEFGGFQTLNSELGRLIQNIEIANPLNSYLITGELGTGKKLLAQELCLHLKAKNIIRFKSVLDLAQLSNEDFVIIEGIESLTYMDQQVVIRHLNSNKGTWIFLSIHDVKSLAKKGLISLQLCNQIKKEICISPLRERKEDILMYVENTLSTLAWMTGKMKTLEYTAQEKFKNYNWPGNVSELEKEIEKSFIQSSKSIIGVDDIEIEFNSEENIQLCTLVEMERKLILQTLEVTKNNKSQAARILGISIRTLRNKLSSYRQEGFYESNV